MSQRKAILLVLDGVGIGEMPDASRYGDEGSHTLAHTAGAVHGLHLPHLQEWGLGNITPIQGVPPARVPLAHYGKMAEKSGGKDSTTGHWELAGLVVEREFPTFPAGFPENVMQDFLRASGCKGYLGNKTASGTAIIEELGAEHMRTGFPIVYTSADSVFQIAAHEEVIPLQRLYEMCERTRAEVCVGQAAVGRVIARPFTGSPGSFKRTTNRKDFSFEPPAPTLLDVLKESGVPTAGVGKVDELFAHRGFTSSLHTRTNAEGVEEVLRRSRTMDRGFIIANLGDFDTLYGHRNDPSGFGRALEAFDAVLPDIAETVRSGDMLIVTADHGNDPVTPSTDHSREYVPLLCYAPGGRAGTRLGTRDSFSDVACTLADFFGVRNTFPGTSFLSQILY
ncbi:MAG: phosphopentomutase [Bacteroidetes bacterium]|nr:phosphopentomutase [Bacteroidota bacterium]